jgi:hypothetical protein
MIPGIEIRLTSARIPEKNKSITVMPPTHRY